ncbi:MAG: hypothetical protein AB7H97_11520 [Pseudobdellovibrionaceae bacterium]
MDPSLVKDERIPSFAYSWAHKHKSHFISFYSLQHLGRGFYKTGFLGSQLKWNTGIDFYSFAVKDEVKPIPTSSDVVILDSVFF